MLTVLSLLLIAYFTGRFIEKRHFKSLLEREQKYKSLPLISGQWKNQISAGAEVKIFGAGVVIGADYFKSMISGLRALFGGRMLNYESLLDRGRREAILRMTEKAHTWGAEKMVNVRIETAVIGNQSGKRSLPCVEIYAYGTAVKAESHEVQT